MAKEKSKLDILLDYEAALVSMTHDPANPKKAERYRKRRKALAEALDLSEEELDKLSKM